MKSIVVGTAGHIDHGKSALVRALTGTDPDRLKEEQERGITIDLGFAHWQVDDVNVAFVDVPGHERFVRNMLAGVSGIDAVALVVAADESVMPQTREHFEICRLLRIPDGLVVLTKSDLVDGDTIELVKLEVRDLVAGSFLERAPVLAVSSRTGQGLPALREALVALVHAADRDRRQGASRLPIDRVFTVRGFGTVVTGTLVSGEVGVEEELLVQPSGRRVKVRGIQVHGHAEARAIGGQRVALNLGGIDVADLGRGETVVEPGAFEPTRVVDAVVEVVPGARPLRHGTRVRFHQGTSEVLGRIALAAPVAAGEAPFTEVPPGSEAYVRLRLEKPAVLTRGDRYILRAYSPPTTIAGGQVLDPRPPRAGIRRPGSRARFERLHAGRKPGTDQQEVEDRALLAMAEDAGASGLPMGALTSRAGIPPALRAETAARLVRAGTLWSAGDCLLVPAVVDTLKRDLVAMLEAHHRAEPLLEGMPREEVRERLFARAGNGVFERVIAELASAGRIQARDRIALAGHRVLLSADEERGRATVGRLFREAGLKPPDVTALAQASGLGADVLDRVVKLLLRQKVLVRIDTLLFHQEALARLREDIAELKRAAQGKPATLDVAAFKDRYGISRKFAIPLLEYLDRERVTRRVGDVRVVA
jgi:selenocysteine-specific elongation factor